MTEIADVVNVTVNVADSRVSQAGFGTPIIIDLIANTVFAERVRQYPNLEAVAVDFATTTKVYKAAAAIFSQERVPTAIKVGRVESGDANITAGLNAILAEDTDFYALISAYKVSADIQEIAAWTEANGKIYLASSEDADVLTVVTTDVLSVLQGLAYDRTAYMWHHQSGVDVTGASYTIASGVATVVETGHGLRENDPVTFDNSSATSIDGNNTVATVVDPNTYTVTTTAADEAGPATVDYFARYTFPEAAWVGYMLPSTPGSETWFGKQLSGITPAPKAYLTATEEATVLGKDGNLYTTLAGVGHTHPGAMVSGRFIDIQRGIDWIQARIGETIANSLLNAGKIPYTDAGMSVFRGDISSVLSQGVSNNLLGPLLDDSGDFYRIFIPKVADQQQADRIARFVPGITAETQLAGAAQKVAITINAQV